LVIGVLSGAETLGKFPHAGLHLIILSLQEIVVSIESFKYPSKIGKSTFQFWYQGVKSWFETCLTM